MLMKFENATIIDGSGHAPFKGSVLVGDERIVAVVPAAGGDMPAPNPDTVIDCEGLTLMPGMAEAHCHISFNDLSSMYQAVESSPKIIRSLHSPTRRCCLSAASRACFRRPLPSRVSMSPSGSPSTGACLRDRACGLRGRRSRPRAISAISIPTTSPFRAMSASRSPVTGPTNLPRQPGLPRVMGLTRSRSTSRATGTGGHHRRRYRGG